jgi:hypothetical protein
MHACIIILASAAMNASTILISVYIEFVVKELDAKTGVWHKVIVIHAYVFACF